tara:strand:+ start:1373 stop:1795 length:423 start_codon:yes stop_codon:yes gene_type:complete
LRNYNLIILLFLSLVFSSCNETGTNLNYLSGYWKINSVSMDGKELKNFPFSNTIDYFILNENSGFRKKVKPRIDGNFDITLHQIQFEIDKNEDKIYLVYGKGKNFIESIMKVDSTNLHIKSSDGLLYEYKRFYPKNYINE